MFPIINNEKTGQNIRHIMNEKGITVKYLQEYLGLSSHGAIYHWFNGKSLPGIDNLLAMSKLFDMRMEEIIVYEEVEIDEKM